MLIGSIDAWVYSCKDDVGYFRNNNIYGYDDVMKEK